MPARTDLRLFSVWPKFGLNLEAHLLDCPLYPVPMYAQVPCLDHGKDATEGVVSYSPCKEKSTLCDPFLRFPSRSPVDPATSFGIERTDGCVTCVSGPISRRRIYAEE